MFAQLVQAHYGLQLTDKFTDWLSSDGKELRGSIVKGQQRGEVYISIIPQSEQAVVAQTYYNTNKESERPVISNLLKDNSLMDRKIILDALHLIPTLLEAIHYHEGPYLIGLKDNQTHLRWLCFGQTVLQAPCQERADAPKRGHGRNEEIPTLASLSADF